MQKISQIEVRAPNASKTVTTKVIRGAGKLFRTVIEVVGPRRVYRSEATDGVVRISIALATDKIQRSIRDAKLARLEKMRESYPDQGMGALTQ